MATQPAVDQRAPAGQTTDHEPASRPAPARSGDVLIARLEGYLATLRSGHPLRAGVDVARAEQVANALRILIADTALASAADRARVRAAVHCFVSRGVIARITAGGGISRNRVRPGALARLGTAHRVVIRFTNPHDLVVNALLRELGRSDLVLPPEPSAVA